MSKSQQEDIAQLRAREKTAADLAVRKALDEANAKSREAAEQAAAKALKSLEQAEAKSFDNVVNQYYQATIGKIVAFVHQGFFGEVIDAVDKGVKSYRCPVATYTIHGFVHAQVYIHNLMQDIMAYFSGKPKIRTIAAEKSESKDSHVDASVIKVTNVHQEEIPMHNDVEKNKDQSSESLHNSKTPPIPIPSGGASR